jgi:hypothetical protein
MRASLTAAIIKRGRTSLPEGLISKHLGTIYGYHPDFFSELTKKITTSPDKLPPIIDEMSRSVDRIEKIDCPPAITSDASYKRNVQEIVNNVLAI